MRTFFVDCYTSNVEQSQKIDKFLELLSKSGVCDLITEVQKSEGVNEELGGRPSFNPYNMLAVILYNFAFGKGTLRDIEDKCKNDLRCIYLIQDEQPTHASFGNYINKYILPNQGKIFSLITKAIFDECEIDMKKIYLDSSKYEANANKYKFVWKPTTFHNKVSDKIRTILDKYGISRGVPSKGIIESKLIASKLIELDQIIKEYDLTLKENKKYKKELDDGRAYIGSANQRLFYLTDRYKEIGKEYYSGSKRKAEIKLTADQAILIGVPSANTLKAWEDIKEKAGGNICEF